MASLDTSVITNVTEYLLVIMATPDDANITVTDGNLDTRDYDEYLKAAKVGVPFMTMLTIWILLVNLMIMLAPAVHKPLRKKAYVFLSNLAMADFISSASVIFFLITCFLGTESPYVHNSYFFIRTGHAYFVYCKSKLVLSTVPVYASVLNLLLIAIDR